MTANLAIGMLGFTGTAEPASISAQNEAGTEVERAPKQILAQAGA